MQADPEGRRFAGACLCGAVRFELTPPSRFCEERLTRYFTDTGATRSFCSRCGSTLLYEGPRWPGEVHVVLANVLDDIDRAPAAHVHVDHGARWFKITDSLPQFGGPAGNEPRSDPR